METVSFLLTVITLLSDLSCEHCVHCEAILIDSPAESPSHYSSCLTMPAEKKACVAASSTTEQFVQD